MPARAARHHRSPTLANLCAVLILRPRMWPSGRRPSVTGGPPAAAATAGAGRLCGTGVVAQLTGAGGHTGPPAGARSGTEVGRLTVVTS